MKDRDQLFAAARAWNPVDRALLDRVAARLERRRRMPMLPIVAMAAVVLLLLLRSTPEIMELAAPPERTPPRLSSQRLAAHPLPPKRRKPARLVPRTIEQPAPETPLEIRELAIEAPPRPPKKRYLPRAIAEFQQIDWRLLEAHDELPRYVQSIIERRDRHALLAALDRLDLDRELLVVRGELRAGESRCDDAIADFIAAGERIGARRGTSPYDRDDVCGLSDLRRAGSDRVQDEDGARLQPGEHSGRGGAAGDDLDQR